MSIKKFNDFGKVNEQIEEQEVTVKIKVGERERNIIMKEARESLSPEKISEMGEHFIVEAIIGHYVKQKIGSDSHMYMEDFPDWFDEAIGLEGMESFI